MNNILSEKEYQHFIMDRLSQDNSYIVRKATSYDRLFAMDRELLFQFLNDTQPEEMEALRKIYKADLEDTLVNFINDEVTKARGSLLDVLKHGIEISNMKLELMYTKPATTFNRELLARYEKNIFSVMEEVWASDDERVDLVIFLNGIAIMSFELKCNAVGQSYQDAIYQYRVDRDPNTRLFRFKAGCLVNFAMDLEQVYMTTKLAGNSTFFLPFNMGNGEGVNAGAGNPTFKDKYSVSYMWEDILKKDTVLDLISKFIFIETKESKDELTGKTKKSENIIFPRYHQLDVIRKLLADVRENGSTQNYLIQHSAGSGKTNSIAWLAHRLTSLHDADNKIIFDKVKLPDDDTEYSEASINGFPEDRLTKEFDKDEYQVLLVANKYQTGFDQPKLCAMYVLKKLKGVSAVQTLSRLNRICPPFEKKTFVLDFVNTYEDIKAAFAPYYTTTLLSASVTPTAIYDLEAQIDAYTVLDLDDIEKANELLYKGNISSKDKQKLTFYFKRAKNRIEQYELIKQHEIVSMMRHFVRFYEFLLQVSCFEDTDLHKKYNFITYLLAYINIKHPGGGYNLDGKIKATNFVQKKSEEHTTPNLVAQPVVKLPTAESFGLTEAKEERLSQIIAEINSRTGKAYDNDVAVKAMLQIRDILLKSDKLKTSARNNTVKDFEFSYFDDIDDALIEGLEQNQDFFSLLLSNDEIKRQVLGIFTDEIYKSLREA